MKRNILSILLIGLLSVATLAASKQPYPKQIMPKFVATARYVYVRAYDGDQFSSDLLPEDRKAITTVQNELQKWGHYIVVYEPKQAEITLIVQSRPTEDVLAVYDGRHNGEYLWRVTQENGLQPGEAPLVKQFEQAVEQASK